MNKLSDNWQTPQDLFDVLNKEFNFDIDLCATRDNKTCIYYCSDFLNDKYRHESDIMFGHVSDFQSMIKNRHPTCFMNPPYSNPKPFIEKAWEDSKHCKIVCLVKCDPSTKWWATFWEYGRNTRCGNCLTLRDGKYLDSFSDNGHWLDGGAYCGKWVKYSDPKPGCEVRFFPKRIQFDPPQELIDSGEVWREKGKWVRKCDSMKGCTGWFLKDGTVIQNSILNYHGNCKKCKGKGYKPLSGPSFACALLIFDRRNT